MEADQLNDLSYRIIGAGIEVHRTIGPGLLESTYRKCMEFELRERGMNVMCEQPIPIRYKTLTLVAFPVWAATRPATSMRILVAFL
jgi:GxxExxY protein